MPIQIFHWTAATAVVILVAEGFENAAVVWEESGDWLHYNPFARVIHSHNKIMNQLF